MNKELLVIVNKNVTVDLAVWFRKSIQWDKLSNSGDTLVLQVPSTSREARYGWPNPSCVVISLKTFEKKVSNRGSKSEYILNHPTNNINIYSVKEQRVDGSYHVNNMWLRCTLRDLTPLMMCREKAQITPLNLSKRNIQWRTYSSSLPVYLKEVKKPLFKQQSIS